MTAPAYDFDRFLRYDELTAWLHGLADDHPGLVSVESYGRSYEGRDLWLATVTDASTGGHLTKPAHWVDASIHATELTATVAACFLLHRLVTGYAAGDGAIVDALTTRTFYVAPRVNPDGAEWALADRPRFRRSSVRPWPWRDGHRWPGHAIEDVDGDGRILDMRIPDPNGWWMPHAEDPRLMVPVPAEGAPAGAPRYRMLWEGSVTDHDGFTVPQPGSPERLDLNRNFPAGWSPSTRGSGDHPLSEPEVDALVRAIVARPNICGYHAFHTSGGVLLRPSSTQPDSKLPPTDVWLYRQLGERATALTGYPVHSVFEDFTWDRNETMSGAADDWVYDHLGVLGWTTEFWDVVLAATGTKQSTKFWYTGPSEAELLAVLHWCDEHHPDGYVDWYPFDHPQLGPIEIGGWDALSVWINPPSSHLRAEVAAHSDAIVMQARWSPRLEIVHERVVRLGDATWRVEAGIANTGWLGTTVSDHAAQARLVRPITVEVSGEGATVVGGPARVEAGQLDGRAGAQSRFGDDGTPDRALVTWLVAAPAGASLEVVARHDRAGETRRWITLG
jgi:Zinc carboxypeptidase